MTSLMTHLEASRQSRLYLMRIEHWWESTLVFRDASRWDKSLFSIFRIRALAHCIYLQWPFFLMAYAWYIVCSQNRIVLSARHCRFCFSMPMLAHYFIRSLLEILLCFWYFGHWNILAASSIQCRASLLKIFLQAKCIINSNKIYDFIYLAFIGDVAL